MNCIQDTQILSPYSLFKINLSHKYKLNYDTSIIFNNKSLVFFAKEHYKEPKVTEYL